MRERGDQLERTSAWCARQFVVWQNLSQPVQVGSTTVAVWGERRHFSAHTQSLSTSLASPPLMLPQLVAASKRHERWRGAMQRASNSTDKRILTIAVLGTSVTAGCGAHEPLQRLCDPGHSWGRYMAASLMVRLRHARLLPQVHLWGKNAVMPDWFHTCLGAKVPAHVDVVLLELMPVLDAQALMSHVAPLVQLIRRRAPQAAIVLVGWPSLTQLRSRTFDALIGAMQAHAAAWQVDLLLANLALAEREYASAAAAKLPRAYYGDAVHPNALGHALLGEAVARFLSWRLCDPSTTTITTTEDAEPSGDDDKPRDNWHVDVDRVAQAHDTHVDKPVATGHGGGSHTRRSSAGRGRTPTNATTRATSAWSHHFDDMGPKITASGEEPFEQCLDASEILSLSATATQLPPATATTAAPGSSQHARGAAVSDEEGGWRLVDEGGAKGVRKMGLLSERVGSAIRLGPLLPHVRCGMLTAQLGFLQSWRATQGAFHIQCTGCRCHAIPGFWSAPINPFPIVQTSTRRQGRANNGQPTPGAGCNQYAGPSPPTAHGAKSGNSARDASAVRCELQNASVTAATRFWVVLEEGRSCSLLLHHITYPHGPSLSHSRVRIDSLSLSTTSCVSVCPFVGTGYYNHMRSIGVIDALARCSRAKDLSRGGTYLVPRCAGWECGTAISKAPFLSEQFCVRRNRTC